MVYPGDVRGPDAGDLHPGDGALVPGDLTRRRAEIAAEFPFLARIGDGALREGVVSVWLRLVAESGIGALAEVPWFTVTRAERLGGVSLVAHVRHVAIAALGLSEAARAEGGAPRLDLLLAGVALQDADKLVLTDRASGAPGPAAVYAQHTFYGAHLALVARLPWDVVHMILSHSKNTGVAPQTLEAVILHYADYAVFDIRNVLEGRERLAAEDAPRWARR